jgi:UDP-GlcNAc:undecaprenyl-phosphate/decaprenyl-phosphate GlcNAc-1-phosphate transferase
MVISSVAQVYLFVSGLAVSIVATAALTVLVKHLAIRWNLVDKPNHRSIHRKPIPRIGGIAIVGGFIVGLAFFYGLRLVAPQWAWMIAFPDKWILVGAGMMFLLGLGDDILNIKPKVKLFFQALAAFIVVAAGFRFQLPFLQFAELGALNDIIAAAVTFLWIIGIINAVNLMDGMDGLAAGIGVIAISSLTIALAVNGYGPDIVLVTAFIGARVGFLLYNSHPASIFMGDSGSLFLGFILAVFSLPASGVSMGGLSYLVPILALGLPILDTLTAIVRRGVQGKGIFTADSDHIHHRLMRSRGAHQRSTVFILYAVNAIFGVMAILVLSSKAMAQVMLILSITAIFTLLFLLKLGYIQLKNDSLSEKAHAH